MAYWLLKSEPADYSIDDLQQDGVTPWDGIRNFQARNFIRDQLAVGDQVFIYHSSCKQVGIAGVGEVASEPYADPAQFNEASKYFDSKADPDSPKWFVVDIKFSLKAQTLLPLKAMKAAPELAELALFKQSRLSVLPVNDQQWHYISGKIS
ncbi:MAG: EVE domain-containing protein [Pseudomonadales bacterium]|nr:EVE domain-containing protein [Pseudomonadales bacterium]